MKCLRCGYCCTHSMVVIVVDPSLGPVESNLKAINLLEESCPHLLGDKPGEYSCAVHDEPWYSETPCFQHGQIERSPSDLCRMGEHLMKKFGSEKEEASA